MNLQNPLWGMVKGIGPIRPCPVCGCSMVKRWPEDRFLFIPIRDFYNDSLGWWCDCGYTDANEEAPNRPDGLDRTLNDVESEVTLVPRWRLRNLDHAPSHRRTQRTHWYLRQHPVPQCQDFQLTLEDVERFDEGKFFNMGCLLIFIFGIVLTWTLGTAFGSAALWILPATAGLAFSQFWWIPTLERKVSSKCRKVVAFRSTAKSYSSSVQDVRRRLANESFSQRCAEADRVRRGRLRRAEKLGSLEPFEFEEAVAEMYRHLGYAVQQTPEVGDEGKDVIARRGEEILFIECKRYAQHNLVGRPTLQRLVGALSEGARGVLVTTSGFTHYAKDYATGRKLELIDREKLGDLIQQAYPEELQEMSIDEIQLKCEECGNPIKFRVDSPGTARVCPTDGYTVFFKDLRSLTHVRYP